MRPFLSGFPSSKHSAKKKENTNSYLIQNSFRTFKVFPKRFRMIRKRTPHAHTQVQTDEWISIEDGVKSPHEFQVHAKKKCVFRVISQQHSTDNRVCNFTRMFHFTSTLSYQNIIPVLFFDIGLV